MLLAIDIGNSNVSLGVFQGETLRVRAKLSAQTERSADEYATVIYDLLRMNGLSREDLTGCILSSVVPELTGLVEAAVGRLTKAAVLRWVPVSAQGSVSASTILPSWEATWWQIPWLP